MPATWRRSSALMRSAISGSAAMRSAKKSIALMLPGYVHPRRLAGGGATQTRTDTAPTQVSISCGWLRRCTGKRAAGGRLAVETQCYEEMCVEKEKGVGCEHG